MRGLCPPARTLRCDTPLKNFWFRLEIGVPNTGPGSTLLTLGPFVPAEQHLALEDSHYYLKHELALAGA